MTSVELDVIISHYQLAVFDPVLDKPFNDWTPAHFDQGFAWRPESVSFRTISDATQIVRIDVDIPEQDPGPNVIRAIDVPFMVPLAGQVEIASIFDSHFLDLTAGMYQLRFECCEVDGASPTLRLAFRRTAAPVFRLVRVDKELNPGETLLLTATPA